MTEDRACANDIDLPEKSLGACLVDAWQIYGLLAAADLISDCATEKGPMEESSALVCTVRFAKQEMHRLACALDRING